MSNNQIKIPYVGYQDIKTLKFLPSFWVFRNKYSPFPISFINGHCSLDDIQNFFNDLRQGTEFHRTIRKLIQISWIMVILATIAMYYITRNGVTLYFILILGFCLIVVFADIVGLIILNRLMKNVIIGMLPIHNAKIQGTGLKWLYDNRVGYILLTKESFNAYNHEVITAATYPSLSYVN